MVNPSPVRQFRGVFTAGNPLWRPDGSAQVCQNVRVMPGYWLRLRSGRIARYHVDGGTIRRIHSLRQIEFPGSDLNLAQVAYAGACKWHWFSSLDFGIDPFGIISIDQSNDAGFTQTNPAPVCTIDDRPVFYNGLGLRTGSESKPGLSSYAGGVVRYFGLDAYAPAGRPSAAFVSGAGHNKVSKTGAVRFYVGLWNSNTNHYSNVVFAGSIQPTLSTPEEGEEPEVLSGTITIGSLTNLTASFNNATEQGELKYVFYATIEGGQVPYLILNAALNAPHSVGIGTSSASLSITNTTDNGWVLDLTHEAPTENYPPRRMRWISFVNGRMYGTLMPAQPTGFNSTGDVFERPFDYSSSNRQTAGIACSKSAGGSAENDPLGDPLQCWPPRLHFPCPSGDAPLWHGAAPDEERLLVITGTSTFFLTETSDGLHEWFSISRIHGIVNPMTVQVTSHGIVWVDQNNMLVMLERGSTTLRLLSIPYQGLMTGTPNCANYILDPLQLIDRYQVWFEDGHSVVHDFLTEEAYTETGFVAKAAASLKDNLGRRHHCIANSGFYTHESQAESNLIPTMDETFTGTGQAKTVSQIQGWYRANWNAMGSLSTRKEFPYFDVIVDSHVDAAFTVNYWIDFQQTSVGNRLATEIQKTPQSLTDSAKRVKVSGNRPVAFKIEMFLTGHSGDRATYIPVDQDGDLAANFYGCILSADQLITAFQR